MARSPMHADMHAAMEVSHGHSSSREPTNYHLRGVTLPVTLVSGPRSDCACRKERQEGETGGVDEK